MYATLRIHDNNLIMMRNMLHVSIMFLCNCCQTMYGNCVPQAAESLTVRGTTAGRRPYATVAEATSTADMADPFATGDAPGTDVTTIVITVVVSAGATAAVANDKQVA